MTVLSELHQDHVNLNKLLVILRHKVEKLREGNHPNFSLMADVIDYIANYADSYHHPREDKLYAVLEGRNVALDPLLAECEAEHQALKQASIDLAEAIDGILHDAVMPMEEFTDRLDAYVTLQSNHLDFEEAKLFPLISETVSDAEWQTLGDDLPASDDPLFGEKQAYQYADLYRELLLDMNAP